MTVINGLLFLFVLLHKRFVFLAIAVTSRKNVLNSRGIIKLRISSFNVLVNDLSVLLKSQLDVVVNLMGNKPLTHFFFFVNVLTEFQEDIILQKFLDRWSLVWVEIEHFECDFYQLCTLLVAFSEVIFDWSFADIQVVENALCHITVKRVDILFRWHSGELYNFFELVES